MLIGLLMCSQVRYQEFVTHAKHLSKFEIISLFLIVYSFNKSDKIRNFFHIYLIYLESETFLQGGLLFVEFMSHYAASWGLLIAVFFETMVISWIYGNYRLLRQL